MVEPARKLIYTFAEYLAVDEASDTRHEYVNGEIFAMSGGTERHAALVAAVIVELGNAVRGGPYRVYSTDLRVATMVGKHYVYPDVSILCAPREVQPGTTDVTLNPSVVVEVLSSSTEAYDRGLKWTGYQQLPSLTDYLLVSQSTARVEQFQRGDGGAWSYRAWGPGERVKLANGATIDVDAIFAGVFLAGE